MADHLGHDAVGADGGAGAAHRTAGYNHWGGSLIYQGVVGLVDDSRRDRQPSCREHAAGRVGLQVVAEEVEPQLAHGAVDHIPPVDLPPLAVFHVLEERPNAEAQGAVQRLQQVCVSTGQVVVGGDDMDWKPRNGAQHGGESGGYGLALSGIHLRHPATVQVNARQELFIGGPEAEGVTGVCAAHCLIEFPWEKNIAVAAMLALAGNVGSPHGDGRAFSGDDGEPVLRLRLPGQDAPEPEAAVNGLRDQGEGAGNDVAFRRWPRLRTKPRQ